MPKVGTAWINAERKHCSNQVAIIEVLMSLGLTNRAANYIMKFVPNYRNLRATSRRYCSKSIDTFLACCICEFIFNSRWGEITHYCPAHGRGTTSIGYTHVDAFGVFAANPTHTKLPLGTVWINAERKHCLDQIQVVEVLVSLGLTRSVAQYIMAFVPNSRDLSQGVDTFLSCCVCEYAFTNRWGGFTHYCPAHGSVKMSIGFGYDDRCALPQTWVDVFGIHAQCDA